MAYPGAHLQDMSQGTGLPTSATENACMWATSGGTDSQGKKATPIPHCADVVGTAQQSGGFGNPLMLMWDKFAFA